MTFEQLLALGTSDIAITWQTALRTIGVALLLGGLISFTYMKTQQDYSSGYVLTLFLLPAVVGVIILLIGNNVARAFSLAGAFSIIRFRSAAGDPKNIMYVLFTMAAGLASGVGAFGAAVLFTVILCAVMFVLRLFRFGAGKAAETKSLKITVPENLGFEEAFGEVFAKFGVPFELQRVRTTELGSLYEVLYAVRLGPAVNRKELLDALRTRNGNLDITLTMRPTAQETY